LSAPRAVIEVEKEQRIASRGLHFISLLDSRQDGDIPFTDREIEGPERREEERGYGSLCVTGKADCGILKAPCVAWQQQRRR
jgi:hypothetical protein